MAKWFTRPNRKSPMARPTTTAPQLLRMHLHPNRPTSTLRFPPKHLRWPWRPDRQGPDSGPCSLSIVRIDDRLTDPVSTVLDPSLLSLRGLHHDHCPRPTGH